MNLPKPYKSNILTTKILKDDRLRLELLLSNDLEKISLTGTAYGDLLMLGMGAFTPLEGFMNYADWKSVCADMKLSNGTFWPIPITLPVPKNIANTIQSGKKYALVLPNTNETIGTIVAEEVYEADLLYECQSVFRTTSSEHPGAWVCQSKPSTYLSGKIEVFTLGSSFDRLSDFILTPEQTRQIFSSRGWKKIVAFQTRNPMHRAHEHLVKTALKTVDGVLIHSLVGSVKKDDISGDVRRDAIDVLLDNYFPLNKTLHAGYPLDMRYAGPREAALHTIFRQNFGCTHIIIGRDHAGFRNFYGQYDSQKLVKHICEDHLEIKPVFFDPTFWCELCSEMVSAKTCPHPAKYHMNISGSELREKLQNNDGISEHFSRPEVVEVLKRELKDRGARVI